MASEKTFGDWYFAFSKERNRTPSQEEVWNAALASREEAPAAPDDLKLSLLMAPYHLNLVVGHDRVQLLAFGRDVWAAAKRGDSPTVRTRNLAEASAAYSAGLQGKEVQHGTATTSAAGTTAAPVNPEGRDSVTNAHAPAAAGAAQAVADDRAAFEADYLSRFKSPGYLGRDSNGNYEHHITRTRWNGWKAHAALAATPAPEARSLATVAQPVADEQIAAAIPTTATILPGEPRKVCMTRLQLREFLSNLNAAQPRPSQGCGEAVSNEQINRAIDAWFGFEDEDTNNFDKRMRAALAALSTAKSSVDGATAAGKEA